MALTISGHIHDTPLSDVLEGLRMMKASGTLVVKMGAVQKSIFLEEGRIVFAASTDSADRLGEVLVRSGALERTNLETALMVSRRTAGFKKLGAILVEQGFVTPRDLFAGLKQQVKDILFSTLSAEDGTYRLDNSVPPDVIPLQINIQDLLQEFSGRMKR